MIGQEKVLNQVDNLIKKGFPRFLIITGQKGQGKTELALYISKQLNIPIINVGIKVDDIRDIIDTAYRQTEPFIYLVQDADKMSLGAKNSLLKVIEEPPNKAYFILELQQIENTLETIKSRCQEIKMEQYREPDIERFMNEYHSNEIPLEYRPIIFKICQNNYQISLVVKYNPKEFLDYVKKVYENIYIVQGANSFKLAEKLDLKDTGEGYDLELFWNTYMYVCSQDMFELLVDINDANNLCRYDILGNCIIITSKYLRKLSINGINKQSLLDMWILDIRREWKYE